MVECVILVGLPASGKSSFYRERFAGTHVHVSKDRMRNNPRPQRRQEQLVAEALALGRSVVVDNTNATVDARAALISLARQHGAAVVGYVFETDVRDAVRRNRARQGKDRVPDVAIFTVRKRFEPPSFDEGFDRLARVTLLEQEGRFQVQDCPR